MNKCPCCGSEVKEKIPSATVWDFNIFMEWLQNHEEYPELKKNNYNLKHYHSQVKNNHFANKFTFEQILQRVMKYIKCDVDSKGKFPVQYNAEVKQDIRSHAYTLVSEL